MKKQKMVLGSILATTMFMAACAPQGISEETAEIVSVESQQAVEEETAAETTGEPVELTVGIVAAFDAVLAAHELACEGISEAYPEISKINLVNYASHDEFFSQLPTQIAAGTAPDIVKCDAFYTYEYAQKELFVPVDESVMDLSDFDEEIVDLYRIDGTLYASPILAQPYCLVVNKDIFNELGLEIPKYWDEFEDVCKVLKDNGYVPLGYENTAEMLSAMILSFGGSWNRGVDFASEANCEAVDFLIDMVKKEYFVLPQTLGFSTFTENFTSGNVAMALGGPWYNGVIQTGAPNMDYALMKFPTKSEETRGTVGNIDGYYLIRGTDVTLASKALNWLSRYDFEKSFYDGVGAIVANREIRNSYFEKYTQAIDLQDAMPYVKDANLPEEATKFMTTNVTELGNSLFDPETTLTAQEVFDNVEQQLN